MKRSIPLWIPLCIIALALVAAGAGVFWQGTGGPIPFTTARGEMVQLYGQGIYRYDSVSGAVQARANDLITLVVGIPLLLIGLVLSQRGSLRGHLLLTGSIGFFLYTYASMAFMTAYNVLFLVYVALFSLSLFGFIAALSSLDPEQIAGRAGARFPRRAIIGYLLFVAVFLTLAWLGRIVSGLQAGEAPFGLDSYTTLVIQVLDLGVIVPACVITAVLLWRQQPWGYTLSSVLLVKILTMGAALVSMIIGQLLAGVAIDPVQTILFVVICISGITLGIVTLGSIEEERIESPQATRLRTS